MNGGCQVIPVECPSWQSKMRILKDLTRADSSQLEIVTKSDDPWREKAVFSLKSKSYLLSNKGQEILE